MAARLVSHENTNSTLATAIIDEYIFLANMTAIRQALQHAIIRRLVRMMLRIGMTIIATRGFNL